MITAPSEQNSIGDTGQLTFEHFTFDGTLRWKVGELSSHGPYVPPVDSSDRTQYEIFSTTSQIAASCGVGDLLAVRVRGAWRSVDEGKDQIEVGKIKRLDPFVHPAMGRGFTLEVEFADGRILEAVQYVQARKPTDQETNFYEKACASSSRAAWRTYERN